MTCLKRISFALALCLVASIPSWGQSAKVVYVATGDSNVYAAAASGASKPLISSTNTSYSGDTFSSLAVGPDNISGNVADGSGNTYFFLYACDSTNSTIIRLKLSTDPFDSNGNLVAAASVDTIYSGGPTLSGPVCGRVDSNGDLYVSSSVSGSGVYVFPGVSTATGGFPLSPTAVYNIGGTFTGGGIAQKNTGDLLIVNRTAGTILRAQFVGANPPNPPYSPFAQSLDATAFVSGLSSPTAIARISTGDFFVANQGTGSVLRFNPASPSMPTTCSARLPNGNVTLSSVAASEDNFVYAGIASTSPNKREVLILNGTASNCGSTGTPISLSNVNATSLAAVAVPPVAESPVAALSSSSTDKSTGVTSSTFNFGSSIVETLTEGCALSITQSQVPISYLTGLLPASNGTTWLGGAPIPSNGEGGFGTLYTVTAGNCLATNTDNDFIIGAYEDGTQFTSSRIIRCDSGSCSVIDTTGNWPVGGLLPNDGTVGGKVPGFSQFFLANGNLTASETGSFCGFGSPLTYGSSVIPSFSSGQSLSVKFKVAQSTGGNCSNGPYVTDAIALLSVAQVSNTQGTGIITPKTITSSGNSSSTEPIFTYTPTNQQYQFSLSLKGFSSGTYALIVTFLSNTTVATLAAPNGGATYVVTYFQVQ